MQTMHPQHAGTTARIAATTLALTGLAVHEALGDIIYTLPAEPITVVLAAPEGDAMAPLDIDNDGVPEFTVHVYRFSGFVREGAYVRTERNGAYLPLEILPRLASGALIGPPDDYTWSGSSDFWHYQGNPFPAIWGEWEPGDPPAFFGFRFDIAGQSHFGWARAQIDLGVTVFDYAYESLPGVAIAAGAVPAPGSLALPAVAAVASTRRRRP